MQTEYENKDAQINEAAQIPEPDILEDYYESVDTAEPKQNFGKHERLWSILSYLVCLIVGGYVAAILFAIFAVLGKFKKTTFFKYHFKQAIRLFICSTVISILVWLINLAMVAFGYSVLGEAAIAVSVVVVILTYVASIINIVWSVIGIVNVVRYEMKPLPVIGTLFSKRETWGFAVENDADSTNWKTRVNLVLNKIKSFFD